MGKLAEKQRSGIVEYLSGRNFTTGCHPSVIDDLEELFQYETTEPGVPLSDEEWYELTGGNWVESCRAKIDAVLAKRNVARPAPAEVNGNVLVQMLDKWFYGHYNPAAETERKFKERMAAVANVLLVALCRPITSEELEHFREVTGFIPHLALEFLRYRVGLILKPKEKSFKEEARMVLYDSGMTESGINAAVDEIVALVEKHGGVK
jgi:hypothetical protein